MATYNTKSYRLVWIVIASLLILSGYMDAQDANLMERSSVQVAAK